LRSAKNDRYYIGSTVDINRRFLEHSNGQVKATKYILPLELVFAQTFQTIKEARHVEYVLKNKKSRVIIESIIKEGRIGFIE
jgi:predicted GIY-YIG superfamily endonuclease